MKRTIQFVLACFLSVSALGLQSCDNDDNDYGNLWQPTALVTVCPQDDESVMLRLDDKVTLRPVNLSTSPYGKKEVRALVNYNICSDEPSSAQVVDVKINWIDSIRTKLPVPDAGVENTVKYGNDPIEVVKDWVTVAEDGYLTLRIRTVWGNQNKPHILNLLTDGNPDNPLEFELRHNANGETAGVVGDALIAFNLNDVIKSESPTVKIKLKWTSFSGEKSTEFDLIQRTNLSKNIELNSLPDRSFQ